MWCKRPHSYNILYNGTLVQLYSITTMVRAIPRTVMFTHAEECGIQYKQRPYSYKILYNSMESNIRMSLSLCLRRKYCIYPLLQLFTLVVPLTAYFTKGGRQLGPVIERCALLFLPKAAFSSLRSEALAVAWDKVLL